MRWKCFLAGGCIGAAVLLFPRFPSKAAEAEGSKPIYEYRFEHNVMVPMKDGTKLATDIYIPKTDKPVPALVVRTPYNKELSSNPEYGKYYASRGYAVAIQDVRGRFASEGEFYNYLNDGVTSTRTVTTPSSGSPRSPGAMGISALWAVPTGDWFSTWRPLPVLLI